ncbi:MAG: L-fucose/L-arabinose isomerase family protein [Spirochaetota bacterium]
MKLTVALIGAVHPNMPGDDSGLFRRIAGEMKIIAGEEGASLVVFPDLLRSEDDGKRAREFCEQNGADLVLLFNASLPYGRVILPLARVNARLALWSVPEPEKSGVLQLNSFCGTNMLGSIVGNYLNHYDIPFKYFYGLPGSGKFRESFGVTVRALKGEKALSEARIAQVGGLADGFENMYIDERDLEYRFGTRLDTRHTVEEIVLRAESFDAKKAGRAAEEFITDAARTADELSKDQIGKAGRLYLAFREFAEENGYSALGISCWSRFQEIYGIAVCGVLSRLNDVGIVAACEGDIPAVVNMLIFNAMSGGRSSLNDLVAFDEEDSTINLWHCGVAPGCWADKSGVCWDRHFNIGCYQGKEWKGEGVIADMQFRPGRVTVATMDNSFDNLFILNGNVVEGKPGYYGSTGWVGSLELNGTAVELDDLMNTIVVERVNHHYPAVYGDFRYELNEFAAWKGIRTIAVRPYAPYMQNPTRKGAYQ